MMKFKQVTIIFLFLLFSANIFAQSNDLFLGIKLRAEVQSLVKEVEKKTGKKIDAEFSELGNFQLGSLIIFPIVFFMAVVIVLGNKLFFKQNVPT